MNKQIIQIIKITGAMKKSLRFLFFSLAFTSLVSAQTQTNFDIFYTLVDSATTNAVKSLSAQNKKLKLNLELGNEYSVFANRIISNFQNSGFELISDESSAASSLNFVIEDCSVEYGDVYRDGLFGDFLMPRELKLSGNYLSASSKLTEFNFTSIDTVYYDDMIRIENRSYPFTQGELPDEPFFSSLLEPVVAIGAAAVTVILFFTIRSK